MAKKLHDYQDTSSPRQVASVSMEDAKFIESYIEAYDESDVFAHVHAVNIALQSIDKEKDDFGYAHALFERVPANKILQQILDSKGFGLIRIAEELISCITDCPKDKKQVYSVLKTMLDIFDVDQSIGISGKASGRMVDMDEVEKYLSEWSDERLQSCIKE